MDAIVTEFSDDDAFEHDPVCYSLDFETIHFGQQFFD